jgi:hypothetical protein
LLLNALCNWHKPMRLLPRLFFLRAIVALLCIAFTVRSSPAQSAAQIPPEWGRVLSSLAHKIAAGAKPAKTFSLDVRNISSLNDGEVDGVRQMLVADLSSLGLKIKMAPADAQLQVTLSESANDYVWVAEIRRGETSDVVMVSAERGAIKKSSAKRPSLTLQRKLIWEQDARILDFGLLLEAAAEGASILVILEPESIAFYEYRAGEWQLNRGIDIAHERPVQRDVRGRIDLQAGKAELPGSECAGNFQRPETVTCVSTPATKGAALVGVRGENAEDRAMVVPVCGVNDPVLISGPGDWTEPDFIQIYEGSHQRGAVSQQIQFAGPVLALWASEDGKTARVVSRNLKTGAYEASIVSVSCGD